VTWLDDVLTS